MIISVWTNPDWTNVDRCHDWRNHVSDEIIALWATFNEAQKEAIYNQAKSSADDEEWD